MFWLLTLPFRIVFGSGLALTNLNQLTATTAGSTTATFATPSDGGTNAAPALTFTTNTSPTAMQLQTYLNLIPALAGNVAVAGPAGGPLTVVYRNALGDANISDTALSFTTAARPDWYWLYSETSCWMGWKKELR